MGGRKSCRTDLGKQVRQKRRGQRCPRHTKGGHMFGLGSKSIVGLDVGSSSIKAVELRKTRTGIEVAHLGLEPIARDIVVDSMIVDSGKVSAAIAKLFAD